MSGNQANPSARATAVDAACVSGLLSFTLFFSGPGHVYFGNLIDYPFGFSALILPLLALTAAAMALIGPLIFLAATKLGLGRERVIAAFFALALLCWAQGTVMVWDYGQFDGKPINWEGKFHLGLIDGAIWAAVMAAALWRARIAARIARAWSVGLIFVQVVSLVVLAIATPAGDLPTHAWTDKGQFEFSEHLNVLIIVHDTYQTDVFGEIVREDPAYAGIFDGFTYFPDAVSGYPNTIPAFSLFLSGRYFDNSVPIKTFIRDTFMGTSVPRVLKERGYESYLSEGDYIHYDEAVATNIRPRGGLWGMGLKPLKGLLNVSMFRYSPHLVKKIIFERIIYPGFSGTGKDGYRHRDLRFVTEMQKQASLSQAKATFKLYHLLGAHLPYRLDENLQYRDLPHNKIGLKTQAKAVLRITEKMLDTLKRLGVYEETLILVIADHGLGTPEEPPNTANDDMAYLAPLVLIKPIGAHGALRTSGAPVHLADIPKTIFSELGLDVDVPGTSMFALQDGAARTRRYFSYNWRRFGLLDSRFLPPMREYLVTGPSRERGSWSTTGSVYLPSKVISASDSYRFGEQVLFGKDGNSDKFQLLGWTHATKNTKRSFAIGSVSKLRFKVTPTRSALVLRASITLFKAKGKIKSQRVDVEINGAHAGRWEVVQTGVYEMALPYGALQGKGFIDLSFSFPDAKSPYELGIGTDTRPLSVLFQSVQLSEKK